MVMPSKPKRPKRLATRSCLGPVADLEAHLPEEWWRKLFNALYVKTDGDVVENTENTRREVDFIVTRRAIQPHSHILDLCCGQGRHCLELARRGFKHVMGLDRSRYLVRLAKKRAQTEGLQVLFKEGDARNPRLPENSMDCVAIMGNSFGYFSNKQDDEKVLTAVGKILRPSGQLVLDITDGAHMHEHFDKRSWEWIDEHHFVCRERTHQPGRRAPDLARSDRARRDGRDRRPVLCRAPLHAREHRQADGEDRLPQRAPPRPRRGALRPRPGPRHDGAAHPAQPPTRRTCRSRKTGQAAGARRHGADGRPPPARPGQARRHLQPRGPRHRPQAQGRAGRAAELQVPLSSTTTPRWSAICPSCAPTWSSICATRGSTTTPSRSCTCRPCSRCWASATPAPGPSALAACYDKGLVRAVAQGARRAGAARELRAPGRPGRDAAVRVPGAAQAQPGRQQPGHHQGCGRHQREGAARLRSTGCARTSPSAACWCRSS